MARYRVGLETRARILDAIRRLLGVTGPDGVTLKAITDHAGVGSGSFYNLFGSKEEAVFEVVRDAIAAVDPDPDGAGSETLAELVDAFVAFITGEPDIARIYLQLAVGGGLTDERLRARVARSHDYRVGRFAEAIAREHPQLGPAQARQHGQIVLASLTGLALNWLFDPDFAFAAHARTLTGLALRDPAVPAAD